MMRPRRKVALYSSNPDAAAAITFLLHVRLHVNVTLRMNMSASPEHEQEIAILLLNQREEVDTTVALSQRITCPHIVLDPHGLLTTAVETARAHLGPGNSTPLDIVDHVSRLLVRKRGPKPHPE